MKDMGGAWLKTDRDDCKDVFALAMFQGRHGIQNVHHKRTKDAQNSAVCHLQEM